MGMFYIRLNLEMEVDGRWVKEGGGIIAVSESRRDSAGAGVEADWVRPYFGTTREVRRTLSRGFLARHRATAFLQLPALVRRPSGSRL